MEQANQSTISEFVLKGLTDNPNIQPFLFMLFLLMYAITIIANSGLIFLTVNISKFHSPMYTFLSSLSFTDICCSTVITPRMLYDILSEKKTITFIGCALQLYFFTVFGCSETYMLSLMAYDRYVAVCHPLRYSVIMNISQCIFLVCLVYVCAFLTSGIETSCILTLSFCGANVINHFYCDMFPLMELSCTDWNANKNIIFALIFVLVFFCSLITLSSYVYIFITILKIRSSEGRHKAFATCTSHLSCVFLFYGTAFFIYLRPGSINSLEQDKVVSIFYTTVIPLMNPLIYSLRNKDVKQAIWFIISKLLFSSKIQHI
ncbi:olfactory receptor 8G17-like [Discoglossus pictus]